MGFMFCTSQCLLCDKVFTFNPDLVPSIRASRHNGKWFKDPNGSREPICKDCMETANTFRLEQGLEPLAVLPGAYEAQEVG